MNKIVSILLLATITASVALAETDYIAVPRIDKIDAVLGIESDKLGGSANIEVTSAVLNTPAVVGDLTVTGGDLVGDVQPSYDTYAIPAAALIFTSTVADANCRFMGNANVYTNVIAAPGAAFFQKSVTLFNGSAINMVLEDSGTLRLTGDLSLGLDDNVTLYGQTLTNWVQTTGLINN